MPRNIEVLAAILADLFRDELYDAVVADGWPRAMVREGFAMHQRTWDASRILATINDELATLGTEGRAKFPEKVAHLWPALPGAGVTPVLYGYLLGVPEQRIKPSSRGTHFAEYFVETWRRHDDSVTLSKDWQTADHVVVSGSDETVAAVEEEVGAERVTGYGHRVSFAIVEADGDETRWVDPLATDIVMWHQQGCFSARSVLFVGDEPEPFMRALGAAIAHAEERLDATLDDAQLALRMQRRGAAEFETVVHGDGLGWVELRENFDGEQVGPHAVSVVPWDATQAELHPPITLARHHIQGIALGVSDAAFDRWEKNAEALGATRVCRPGELQMPPANWPHDGRPNVLGWLGLAPD